MSNRYCVGVIEAIGMSSALEAADTMLKAANVKLIGYEYSGTLGRIVVKIEGPVSAVKTAIAAAEAATEQIEGTLTGYESASVYPAMEKIVYDELIDNAETVSTDKQIASGKRPQGYRDYKNK
ncbi:MAG: BMC domain-containing protein [Eubacteriaceae bacterium]|nr:BMC domain-containing protein [Eubacteriaceae bacterium]